MRGDSLRDLYAKTLAVVGLGLLAAAGAIVDYWPVSGEFPTVSAVAGLRNERPMPVWDLALEIPAPRVIRAVYHSTPVVTAPAFARPFRSVRFVEPMVAIEPAASPVPEFDLTRVNHEWSSPMASIDLNLEPPPALVVSGSGASVTSRPLLTGAVSALRKTRASLRDAFRGVVGTFRKVSPFWDATATPSFR